MNEWIYFVLFFSLCDSLCKLSSYNFNANIRISRNNKLILSFEDKCLLGRDILLLGRCFLSFLRNTRPRLTQWHCVTSVKVTTTQLYSCRKFETELYHLLSSRVNLCLSPWWSNMYKRLLIYTFVIQPYWQLHCFLKNLFL
jgi:hypothetical protein